MEFSWPGEKLAIRLWETLERIGIGIFSPTQIRREGKLGLTFDGTRAW